jgi:hypothetical protein
MSRSACDQNKLNNLNEILHQCDELGMELSVPAAGKIAIRYLDSWAESPSAELVEAIREKREAILSILKSEPRSQPEFVPFVSRSLDVEELPVAIAPPVSFRIGERVYYRLTPRVYYWLAGSIDAVRKSAEANRDRAKLAELDSARPLLDTLAGYVRSHYRSDQLARGKELAKLGLPINSPTVRDVATPKPVKRSATTTVEKIVKGSGTQDRNSKHNQSSLF